MGGILYRHNAEAYGAVETMLSACGQVAVIHPTGQAIQMPVVPSAVFDKMTANMTRRIRSVKVVIINFPIIPAPRRIPSATSFAEITK